MAADALAFQGGELAELSPDTIAKLDSMLPPHWSHGNPVDILGDATAERYGKALEITLQDPNADGILVLTAPQGLAEPTQIAELLKPYAHTTGKPILSCFIGGAEVVAANTIMNAAGIPTFQFPDTATRAFTFMWRYSYNLRGLYETPTMKDAADIPADRAGAQRIVAEGLRAHPSKTSQGGAPGSVLLTEAESKRLLASYLIPTVETRVATSADDAVKNADEIGYPVVLKLHSQTITHKTDVGGVQLDLPNAGAVREAFARIEKNVREKAGEGNFLGVTVQPMITANGREGHELILGSSIDPQFGPVLLFGRGGQMVEIENDRALGLPPLNTTLARRMIEQTRISKALRGVRGMKGVNLESLEMLLVRFSNLVIENPRIKEIDINPLLASGDRFLALDARVVLHPAEMPDAELPRPVIRPYPNQYVGSWTMKDGTKLTIRPIRPEDEPAMIEFHHKLSDRSVYLRYFQPLKLTQRTAHERLTRICFIDYDREMALVAQIDAGEGPGEIIAVGRLSKLHGFSEAEIAVLVRDEFQHKGLGTELVSRLMKVANDEKLQAVSSTMLGINREMRAICNRLGFKLHVDIEEDVVNAKAVLG